MNKIGLILIAIAVLAGGAFLVLKQRSGLAAVESAAHYLPAETLVFAEFPDLPRSRTRLEQTALWKLFHEPEVAAFLELPLSQVPARAQAQEHFRRLAAIAPRHGFLALTSLQDNQPKLVAGFAYSGPQAEVDLLLNEAREQIHKALPAVKADRIRHHEDEIESYTHDATTVAGAFVGQWYFIANDVALLKATLDRFRARPGEGSLSDAENYRKSMEPLSEEPDVRYYVNAGFFTEKLVALSAASGQPMPPQQVEQIRAILGVGGTNRMEGPLFRDRLYIYAPKAPALPKLDGSTLALTGPDTLLYYAAANQQPEGFEFPPVAPEAGGANEPMAAYHAILANLQQAGVSAKDLDAAFGNEIGFLLDWQGGNTEAIVGGAVGIADADLARKVVEAAFAAFTRETLPGGAPIWSMNAGPILKVAATLSPKYLLFGLNPHSAETLATRSTAAPTRPLDQNPAFRSALATIGTAPGDANLLVYFDARTAFERVYEKLRPLAALGLAFMPDAARFVDVSKLPPTEVIARNLVPSIGVGTTDQGGYLFESTGTLTFSQQSVLLGGVAGAIAFPLLQGSLPLPGLGSPAPHGAPQNSWTAPADTPAPEPGATPAPGANAPNP